MSRRTICIDLDGVLADYRDGWQGVDHFGEPIPGAQDFVRALRREFDVVIYTTRCNSELNREAPHLLRNRVRDYLDAHGFEYDDIYTGQGKPICAAFIDDRAVQCEPQRWEEPATEYNSCLEEVRNVVLGEPTVAIEYEIPPTRAIHVFVASNVWPGDPDKWLANFAEHYPTRKIRKITEGRNQWRLATPGMEPPRAPASDTQALREREKLRQAAGS